MGFEELTPARLGVGIQTRTAVCLADERSLGCSTGHGESLCPSVVVHADLTDDALDPVAVSDGLAESLEDYTGYTLPSRVAIGLYNSSSQ